MGLLRPNHLLNSSLDLENRPYKIRLEEDDEHTNSKKIFAEDAS